MVDAVCEWVEADRETPSAWAFDDTAVFTGGMMTELEQWFAWRRNGGNGLTPRQWRRQPLKQLVVNRALDFVETTWRLKNTKNYNWTGNFNGTQLALVGWIDGSE